MMVWKRTSGGVSGKMSGGLVNVVFWWDQSEVEK